jgi:heterodisulfide reductase subunit A
MKIGVYVCECGVNIGATVDVEKVAAYAETLPNVAVGRYYKYMCSDPGQEMIKKDIKELGLDKVVVASCSPRMHEPTFRSVLQECGLNPYCLEMANIREQCSWVHTDKEKATKKAIAIVAGAVARASYLEPLQKKEVDVTPQALVIGGGIAGIQAALEIGNMGYKTYLVERTPTIGGRMAQLDKTFPTLDCSACILTPKMVDVSRHPTIELLTYAEVVDVQGYIGNFKVKVKKKPRYIDVNKCTGCGDCVQPCPVEVLDEFNERKSLRKAIYIPFPQAVPQKYTIDRLDGKSPCKIACPAKVNAQGYVQLLGQRKFKEAVELIRKRNPFPAICGRVCHHPCENECLRREIDEPVAINPLKRFAADYVMKNGEEPPEVITPTKKEKIAVIGAGPSGLTCALNLLEKGYPVTVFEASDKPGGMMTSCIPDYRVPEKIAVYDINRILAHGIKIRKNTRVGRDITFKELKKEYDAIYMAIGSQTPATLTLEGVHLNGVLHGLPFLRDAKKGIKPENFGERVIIVGGGNVAMDCAKSSLRLGAEEVHVICLETRDLSSKDRMPAHDWEIEEAEEEGVIIHDSLGPKKILGEKRVIGLQTIVCTSVYENGRFAPTFSDEPAPTIKGDTLIIAIGQRPDFTGFENIELTPWGTIKVDKVTLETNIPGVFAGGDVVRGPASVVEAVDHGIEAAVSIDRYLSHEDLKEGREKEEKKIEEIREEVQRKPREKVPKHPPRERIHDFREIELGFTEDAAILEAERCLSCSICSECLQCESACEADAILYDMEEELIDLDVGAIVVATGFDAFDATSKPEYGYGRYENIITGLEFERLVSASGPTGGKIEVNGKEPEKVVFIQCVGSREREGNGNEYCSRVCCMYTAKQAHLVREKIPDAELTVFYTDMRAFGKGFEEFYNRVQREGVVYKRRELDDPIEVAAKGDTVMVKAKGHPDVTADLVVLATAVVPRSDTSALAQLLNINQSADGFLLEAHPKLRPVDTFTDGIFLAGCCQSPKDIPDTVTQASAAASRVCDILSKTQLEIEATTAQVDELLCRGCGFCVEVCPYGAIELIEVDQFGYIVEVAKVNEAICKGCGACSAACLSGAIQQKGFTDTQILAMIGVLGGTV